VRPPATPGELLTLPDAQQRLGMAGGRGRRLKRLLLAREAEAGKRIMIRLSGGRRPKPRVTWSLLRKHCPELFESKVQQLERDMRGYLDAIDAKISESVAAHMTDQVEPRLDELWQRDEVIAESVRKLAQRVARIASPPKPAIAHGKARRSEPPRAPAQSTRETSG
jgi:hypothetical protein